MDKLPIIAGVEITTDSEGRFSLNALHEASRLGEHKKPNAWLNTRQAQELMKEGAINFTKGGNVSGIFAHELLASSYAEWVSPRFGLQVRQVFIDCKNPNLSPVKLRRLYRKASISFKRDG